MESCSEKHICRFCMKVTDSAQSIFKDNLYKIVKNFTSLDISCNDNLPIEACDECIQNVYLVDNIRKSIIDANHKLQEMYNSYGNFTLLFTVTENNELLSNSENTNEPDVNNIKKENDNLEHPSPELRNNQDINKSEADRDSDSYSASENDLEIDEDYVEISEQSEIELDTKSDDSLSSIITISDENLSEIDEKALEKEIFSQSEVFIPEIPLEVIKDSRTDELSGKDRISLRLMKILASVSPSADEQTINKLDEELNSRKKETLVKDILLKQQSRDSQIESLDLRKYLIKKPEKTDHISRRLMRILGEAALSQANSDDEEDQFDDEMNNLDSIICRKEGEGPLMYHCKLCNVDLLGRKQYNMHKGRHIKKTCPECGLTIRKDYFKKHKLQHVLGKQVCDVCGSEHKSFNGLRMHMFNVHNDNKKIYKCEECNLTFRYKHRFNHHNRHVHIGLRPYQCDHCGKTFSTLKSLRRHVDAIHLKLRNFVCSYCEKGYPTNHALSVHLRRHTKETPYACDICGLAFRHNVSLKTHKKTKHDVISGTSVR